MRYDLEKKKIFFFKYIKEFKKRKEKKLTIIKSTKKITNFSKRKYLSSINLERKLCMLYDKNLTNTARR